MSEDAKSDAQTPQPGAPRARKSAEMTPADRRRAENEAGKKPVEIKLVHGKYVDGEKYRRTSDQNGEHGPAEPGDIITVTKREADRLIKSKQARYLED